MIESANESRQRKELQAAAAQSKTGLLCERRLKGRAAGSSSWLVLIKHFTLRE